MIGTIADQIRAAAAKRWPCQEIPVGGKTALARELGCSRQLVSQTLEGFSSVSSPKIVVCACGKRLGRGAKRLCSDCFHVTLPCGTCEQPVKRRISQITRKHAANPGLVFCNASCRGRYFVANGTTGFAAHPENIYQNIKRRGAEHGSAEAG